MSYRINRNDEDDIVEKEKDIHIKADEGSFEDLSEIQDEIDENIEEMQTKDLVLDDGESNAKDSEKQDEIEDGNGAKEQDAQ